MWTSEQRLYSRKLGGTSGGERREWTSWTSRWVVISHIYICQTSYNFLSCIGAPGAAGAPGADGATGPAGATGGGAVNGY